jgi:hypothetical protein
MFVLAGCVTSNIAWKDFLVECAMSICQESTVEGTMAIICNAMSEHPDGITTRFATLFNLAKKCWLQLICHLSLLFVFLTYSISRSKFDLGMIKAFKICLCVVSPELPSAHEKTANYVRKMALKGS